MIETDVAIVGAGPIGLEIAAGLKELEIPYVQFEAEQIGHTIQKWPRNTKFLSSPERDAIAGIPLQTVHQDLVTGEEYLAYLRTVVETLDLEVRTYERVVRVRKSNRAFELTTNSAHGNGEYRARRIVLATGDMNGPTYLNIPGENLAHVTHYFDEPHKYFRRNLLIVGGKNSALEAALRCWRAGARVTISYRRDGLDRKRVYSRTHLELSILTGKKNITFLPETVPVEIKPTEVILKRSSAATGGDDSENGHGLIHVPADFVLLCTGFTADMRLFRQAGVTLTGDDTEPQFDEKTMETDVPGVYVAGTAASGNRHHDRIFIATSHVHSERIVRSIAGRPSTRVGTVPVRRYPFESADIETM